MSSGQNNILQSTWNSQINVYAHVSFREKYLICPSRLSVVGDHMTQGQTYFKVYIVDVWEEQKVN